MSSRKTELIHAAIRDVLIRDWDPIGIVNHPDCPRDEYDSYVAEIYRILARGESADFLAKHLCFIEDKWMGLGPVSASARLSVARKLKAIDLGYRDR